MKLEVFGINVLNGFEIFCEILYFSYLIDIEENVYIVEELIYFFLMR